MCRDGAILIWWPICKAYECKTYGCTYQTNITHVFENILEVCLTFHSVSNPTTKNVSYKSIHTRMCL